MRRNNDWNRTNEHFSSDRSDRVRERNREYDLTRNSRIDEYDRYGYNRNNDSQNDRYRESDSWRSSKGTNASGRSFYNNNSGNYGMSSAHSGVRNFENRSGHYGKGPKGWKRSDERIKEEACEVLYRDQHIDATNIEVAVNEGIVTLTGTMDSRFGKRHAEECIENLSGVEDVRNEIRVLRPDLNGPSALEH